MRKLSLRRRRTFTFGGSGGIIRRQRFNETHIIVETYCKARTGYSSRELPVVYVTKVRTFL